MIVEGNVAVVERWEPLPNWRLVGNDLAVLTLERPVGTLPVACATRDDDVAVGTMLEVVALGATEGEGFGTLRSARVTVSRMDLELELTQDGVGSCGGDSGAPVHLVPANGAPQLYGIVSSGPPGCEPGPIYASPVLPYSDWIDDVSGASSNSAGSSGCATSPAGMARGHWSWIPWILPVMGVAAWRVMGFGNRRVA